MNEAEQRALRAVSRVLDWAATAGHAWNPTPFHVAGMHPRAEQMILDGIEEASNATWGSPLGVVIQGQGGTGKTHLLGWVRGRITEAGGYFFLVDFSSGEDFWRQITRAMVDDLGRAPGDGPAQAVTAVRRLAALGGAAVRFEGAAAVTRQDLDALVGGLVALDRRMHRYRDTIRALALYALGSGTGLDVAHDHLMSVEEAADGDRRGWGMSRDVKGPQDVAIELSAVLSLTGPAVIAVDQIDALLEHSLSGSGPFSGAQEQAASEPPKNVIDEIAGGLMGLRHATQRTLCLVACLPASWKLIRERAIGTAADRFRRSLILSTISTPDLARDLVERRFAAAFAEADFVPPDPVWPISHAAFASAAGLTPRTVLRLVDAHIEMCRVEGTVRLMEGFADAHPTDTVLETPAASSPLAQPALARLDVRFAALREEAEVADAFHPDHEDELVPPLLSAGLETWIREQGESGRAFSVDPPPGRRPALHARLRSALDPESESEEQRHWTFRVIGARHPIAALKRLNDGIEASGLGPTTTDRCFVVLRNLDWSEGEKTRETLARLLDCGGRSLTLSAGDLRVFDALRRMAAERDPDWDAWLLARRPASHTELLSGVLGDAVPKAVKPAEPVRVVIPAGSGAATAVIRVGERLDTGAGLDIALSTLTRHTAVFAGSGSGKTVFLRRLVEECALLGVSSIVLDPNNDLARLGDPWPEPPAGWGDGDADKATRYLGDTEVMVWTPGLSSGRPLSFQPLPDFAAIRDDRDELERAVTLAVEALAPRAKVSGSTAKASRGQAVLRQALEYFARSGGGDLAAFLDMLSALPFEASRIERADQMAVDLGQNLTAEMINDPLFAGGGETMDPARLLTPPSGKRARVSVISFVGLSDNARPGFVSRLQMALFSWVKKNPARGRPLTGLYVMDEAQSFVPATPRTEALASTLTLASQARKYGLGLVFATQAPRGLHNQIAGNATTQFIGRTNSATQIEVVKTLARARGGTAERVGRLSTGQFYAASTGLSEVLIRTPLCLTHHPPDPLTEHEIITRAQK